MLESIASRLTSYMIAQGVVSPEDEEIHVYGWTMLLFSVGSFTAIISLGALLGQLLGTALFLIFFTFLRSYAGGYHADSFGRCFVITTIIYSCSFLIHYYLQEAYCDWAVLVLLFISIFITWAWAPVDHPNKPFRDQEWQINRRLSRITILSQTAIILGLRFWQPWLKPYLLWAALGMAATSLTLLYVICYPYKK